MKSVAKSWAYTMQYARILDNYYCGYRTWDALVEQAPSASVFRGDYLQALRDIAASNRLWGVVAPANL